MKKRDLAVVLAILVASSMLLGFPASTDAGNGMFKRASAGDGKRRIAAIDPSNVRIGGVARTRARVEGSLGGLTRNLQRNLPIFQKEEVSTGSNARAVLRFTDGSVLTIGAEAEVVLDEFVYSNTGGVITLLKGALRFTSGKLGRPGLLIKMPYATIGIRGTDFWAGELKGGNGVLLLHGEVDVYNEAGKVTLRQQYEGTLVAAADEAPAEPSIWEDGQQTKVLAGVAVANGPLCAMLQKVAKDMFPFCT